MARKAASTKSTGGGGYQFEDKVAVYFAAHLLAATRIFEASIGKIVRIDYQTRDKDWLLDDLLVSFDSKDPQNLALSIKSNRQVTSAGFPSEFAHDAWEQWLGFGSRPFEQGRDRLGLLVGELANDVKTAWDSLLSQARSTTPDRVLERLKDEEQSSVIERAIFKSLQCPSDLTDGQRTDDAATVRLLTHIELIPFDFLSSPSVDWGKVLAVIQSTLKSSAPDEAEQMANSLLALSATLRPAGGTLTLTILLNHLRNQFTLKDYPDFQGDCDILRAKITSVLTRTRGVVGQGVALGRSDLVTQLKVLLEHKRFIVLVGESGSGKSVIAKDLVISMGSVAIWLDGNDLEGKDLGAISGGLGLNNKLHDVIIASTAAATVVVLDGLDRASPAGLANACELLSQLELNAKSSSVHIIITTETSGWTKIQRELTRHLPNDIEREVWPVGLPEASEIHSLLLRIPSLQPIANRPEVCSLLKNLKVLDWVATAAEQGGDIDALSWVSATQVIDWVWSFWIGEDANSVARSGILKKLGELEGDSLGVGLPLHGSFEHSEEQTLGTSELRQLVRVENERCFFHHDLTGDWARLRILLGAQPAALALILDKVKLPRWHRAIRYFGQRLLEMTPGDPSQWQNMLNQLGSTDPPSFAHDLFLESVVFTTNSGVLLEQIWPVLVDDHGKLLRRFLKLFLHSATFPDPRVGSLSESATEQSALASMMRWPYAPYWFPVLQFLHAHRDDVARLSLSLAAKLCKIWLDTVPETTSDNRAFPGRREAAELAVRFAREVQFLKANDTFFEDEVDEHVFEAMLFASTDLPAEVSSLALEFAQRKDWDAEILKRAKAWQIEIRKQHASKQKGDNKEMLPVATFVPGVGRYRSLELPKPWPDGPSRQVDRAFRKVCHTKPQALLRLLRAAPEVAREVIFAICIEAPKPVEPFSWSSVIHDGNGLEDWEGSYPTSFFSGCFLAVLRANPLVGIDVIIKLVDFATERWIDSAIRAQGQRERPSDEALGPPMMLPGGGVRHLLGNAHVFCWYRFGGLNNEVTKCALMALERWLYEELDAGRDPCPHLNIILERARSVAVFGVLVIVGLRAPALFLTCLTPILTIWPVYSWQDQLVMSDPWQIEMTSWVRSGERMFNIIREWHLMPHRKYSLQASVQNAFMMNAELVNKFPEIRKFWNDSLEHTQDKESLELLIARFDPANYRRTPQEDGKVLVEFDWPEPLKSRTEAALREGHEELPFLTFPAGCRRILDGQTSLESDQLDEFCRQVRHLLSLKTSELEPENKSRHLGAICGAAAVLFTLHRAHLAKQDDLEALLLNAVKSILAAPEELGEMDIAESMFPYRWDCFAGELLCVLIADRPDDEWVRRAMAEALMAFHYDATRITMAAAFKLRSRLGDDWSRMQNLTLLWSGLRCCIHRATTLNVEDTRYKKWKEHLTDAFARRLVPTVLYKWTKVGRVGQVVVSRIEEQSEQYRWLRDMDGADTENGPKGRSRRKRSRGFPGLDVQVLQAAFSWMPVLADATSDVERAQWIFLVNEAVEVTLAMLPFNMEGEDEVQGTPYDYDYWSLRRAANCVAQMTADETPSMLWRPILDLGGRAHYWVSAFLGDWLVFAVRSGVPTSQFAERWREMVDYALSTPTWSSSGRLAFRTADLIAELMGLSWTGKSVGAEEFGTAISSLLPQYAQFATRWLRVPHVAARFARFLTQAASRTLLPDGIQWLSGAVNEFDEYSWRDDDLGDSLLEAVRTCWFEYATRLQTDEELRGAFLSLLDILVRRQNPAAFELRDEVARTIR